MNTTDHLVHRVEEDGAKLIICASSTCFSSGGVNSSTVVCEFESSPSSVSVQKVLNRRRQSEHRRRQSYPIPNLISDEAPHRCDGVGHFKHHQKSTIFRAELLLRLDAHQSGLAK